MPSRLSSLLVRDGLVGVKRMEKAFQRQVIYGGSLDTILLEMNLVPEERLTQYLALASGLPPAARDEGQVIEPAALSILTRQMAEQYRAVPVAIEGEAIRLLVCAPLEITELEDLADLIDRPLQPLITPEYRWHLVYSSAYGLDPPARFTTLARSLDVDPTTPPVGRARTVIVDSVIPIPVSIETTDRTPVPAYVTDETSVVDAPLIDDIARGRRHTLIGLNPNRAATESARHEPVEIAPARGDAAVRPIVSFAQALSMPTDGVSRGLERSAIKPLRRSPTSPISTEGRDAPLPVVRAREMLATAEDRDTVFLTLLRAARGRARWAGLLTVQGGAAIGRVGLAEPGLDVSQVHTVLIPLDTVSPFRTVVSNGQPHIGPIVSGDPGIDAMVLRMGGTMPPSALILPVLLRDRVVALVLAHRVHSDTRLSDVTELLPIATAASDALGRLIVKHKATGYRTPAEAPIIELDAEHIATKRVVKPSETSREWKAPDRIPGADERPLLPALFDQGAELSMDADAPRPIDDVLDEIEGAKEGFAEDALAEAIERPSAAIGGLMKRFPGKLRVERFAVSGRNLRASQYGGLLELVIRLGSVASELLIDKMSSPQRDVRFYSAVCAAELRPRNAVFALVERLFDQDFGVRACAIEALSGYPVMDLGQALVRARRAVHSSDPEIVHAAANAVVELGDIEAIADLIGVIERTDRGSEHARRALNVLTAQDFGASEKKWRKWYEANRQRHRIEWLIDGLTHKEDPIREGAINDLRRLTGEYFGYHHDLPRRDREAAAERWAAWWREAGHNRFVVRESERNRPTGELPSRRD